MKASKQSEESVNDPKETTVSDKNNVHGFDENYVWAYLLTEHSSE